MDERPLCFRRLAAALLAASIVSCSDTPSSRPNVILVCMDTVRADHLGCYGYEQRMTTPTIDRLAAAGVVYEDASATAGWTKPSVPSFLTGTYPVQHGVYEGSAREISGEVTNVLASEAVTLAEVFSDRGWRTAAFVKNAQLKAGNGFEQGFDVYRDKAGDAREIRWGALDWIDRTSDERPFFLYLHYLDAHWPYPIPDQAAARFAGAERLAAFRAGDWRALRDAINDGERVPAEEELDMLRSLYDAGIRYIDEELGALITGLERRGLWANTVICVISDHGEEFLEHGRIGHGHGLHENLLRVPWVLRVPGLEPDRVSNPVSLVDVFPTLLAAAGIACDLPVEGIDRLAHPMLEREIFAEHKEPSAYQQSLRAGGSKLVRRFAVREGARVQDTEIAPGAWWEAEIRNEPDAGLVARSMKLRDEPASDPLEVKGRIDSLTAERFTLVGLEVVRTDETELYGELPPGADFSILRAGRPIKVKGRLVDGVLFAQRIKVYRPEEPVDVEIRGPLEQIDGQLPRARVRIGGVWIDVDDRTRWDLSLLEEEGARLGRAELVRIVSDPEARTGLDVALSCFDLRVDPEELEPSHGGSACDALGARLDDLGRALAATAAHGAVRALDAETLDDLRELGYVR